MWDTSKIHEAIHVSQMHRERDVSDMKETCEIHARYMRDTCILRGNQDTCGIHAKYMRNTWGIHAGHVSRGFGGIQARPQVGLEILETRILMSLDVYLDVSHMYPECILNVSCVSCI